MDLELDDDEAKIEERLYKAFGGRAALPFSQKAKFSSWILAFKKSGGRVIMRVAFLAMWFSKCVFSYYPAQFIKPFTFRLAIKLSQGMSLPSGALFLGYLYLELDQLHYNELAGSLYHIVDTGVSIVMLQVFVWEHSRRYLNVGKRVSEIRDTKRVILIGIIDGEERFLGFEYGLPLLMKWMALKVRGLPLICSLDIASDFIWKPYTNHAKGFFPPSPFPCAGSDS